MAKKNVAAISIAIGGLLLWGMTKIKGAPPDFIPEPPGETCTPGAISCQGFNAYQCNNTGTGWDLIEQDSSQCGYIPPEYEEPPGAFCIPGDVTCVGYNAYKCNQAGTAWDLM